MIKCMSCDINFKSQEHLKNLGTAVEIMSVHTDLGTDTSSNQGLALNFQDTQFTIIVVVQMLCEESILLTKMK